MRSSINQKGTKLSPVFATLTKSPPAKSFRLRSYRNWRGAGVLGPSGGSPRATLEGGRFGSGFGCGIGCQFGRRLGVGSAQHADATLKGGSTRSNSRLSTLNSQLSPNSFICNTYVGYPQLTPVFAIHT